MKTSVMSFASPWSRILLIFFPCSMVALTWHPAASFSILLIYKACIHIMNTGRQFQSAASMNRSCQSWERGVMAISWYIQCNQKFCAVHELSNVKNPSKQMNIFMFFYSAFNQYKLPCCKLNNVANLPVHLWVWLCFPEGQEYQLLCQ